MALEARGGVFAGHADYRAGASDVFVRPHRWQFTAPFTPEGFVMPPGWSRGGGQLFDPQGYTFGTAGARLRPFTVSSKMADGRTARHLVAADPRTGGPMGWVPPGGMPAARTWTKADRDALLAALMARMGRR